MVPPCEGVRDAEMGSHEHPRVGVRCLTRDSPCGNTLNVNSAIHGAFERKRAVHSTTFTFVNSAGARGQASKQHLIPCVAPVKNDGGKQSKIYASLSTIIPSLNNKSIKCHDSIKTVDKNNLHFSKSVGCRGDAHTVRVQIAP